MKQRLGKRKHARCEAVTGKTYRACYANGAREHYWAECWFGDGECVNDADDVNWMTGEWSVRYRQGQPVTHG